MALRVQKLALTTLFTPVILASAMFASATIYSTPAYSASPGYCADYARRASRAQSRGGVTSGTARGVQKGVSYDRAYRDCMR